MTAGCRLATNSLLVTLLLWAPAPGAWAQLSLVSRAQVSPWPSAGGNASTLAGTPFTITGGQSVNPSQLSADGRYVVFESLAANLAAGVADRGSRPDVFVHDHVLQTTTLVSRAAGLPQAGNGYSTSPSISANGMFVAFLSTSTDLVPGMTPGLGAQVFLWSRATDSVTLVSHAAGAPQSGGNASAGDRPSISADGLYVAYISKASNLAAGQTEGNGENDVFLYSQASNANVVVSHAAPSPTATANGRSFSPALSGDGSSVAYESVSTDLVAGQVDTNAMVDVFLYQRSSGQNRLVSHALGSSATTGNDESGSPALNAEGSKVVFSSLASNLVAASDPLGSSDVFVFDTASGGLTLVSHAAGATSVAAGGSYSPVIDDAGTLVAFLSTAQNLVAGQVDAVSSPDVFVWRLATGVTTLATHLPGAPTTAAAEDTGPIADLRLAAGGRYVLYGSDNPHLTSVSDANFSRDYFLFDSLTGLNRMVTAISGWTDDAAGLASHASLSADGTLVAFDSYADNVVFFSAVNDHNAATDVFLFDASAGETTLLSLAAPGLESVTAGGDSTSDSSYAVSADGRYAVFTSDAQDLRQVQQDLNDGTDVFFTDLTTGDVRLVSHAFGSELSASAGKSYLPAISADGSRVAFLSEDTNALVPNETDTNDAADVFVWERDTGVVRLVSHSAASSQVTGNAGASTDWLKLSSDGRFIAYASHATNLVPGQVDTNTWQDTFLYDATTGTNTLVSHAAGAPATTGDGYAIPGGLSADGRYLAFVSSAMNVVLGQVDPNGHLGDVFLYDRVAGTTTLLSHPAGGPANTTADGNSSFAILSTDGSKAALLSGATNLLAGFVDGNGPSWPDLYVVDRASGAVTLASHSAASALTGANHFSSQPALSADGQWLAYISRAGDLVSGQTGGGERAAFLYSAQSNQNVLVSHAAGSPTQTLDGGGGTPSISADGALVAFASEGESVVPGQVDDNGAWDVFLYRRADGTSRLLSRVPASATTTGDDYAFIPSLAAGGMAILFYAQADDLLPADFNARSDVFVAWNEQSAPSNPTQLQSDSHVPSTWDRDRYIHMLWSGAADVGSGLRGYSVVFDTSPSTIPDTVVDVLHIDSPFLGTSSAALPDGTSHYFHLRTCDQAGNCSSALHAGPYWIDATPPTAPTGLSSTSHAPGVPSADPTIDVVWTASSDAVAGVDGYGITFSSIATPYCSQNKDLEETVTSFTSDFQGDGNRWAHVCAVDNAGNWSQVAVAGPYRIATQADLGIEQSASPEPVSALGLLSYEMTVTNHGGLDATGVVLTDTLPAGLEFVSSTPGAPTCTHAAGVVSCALGALPFQASATVTIRATSGPGFTGLTHNLARVDGAEPDGNATNDQQSHDVLVVLEKGDLDNDAWPEILFRNVSSGRNVAWLMQGTLQRAGGFLSPDPESLDWQLSAVHDVDGDQRNDLAFWNHATGAVEFWLMNGLTRLGAPVPLQGAAPLPAQWTLQASADFNHDGKADLLWRNTQSQALRIWTMNGAQYVSTLTPNPDHATDANWELVAALDLSEDGNADLLWYNRSSGRVVEWLMDANVQRLFGRFTSPPSAGNANWKVVAAANYGGDSSPLVRWNDLLWRNETTGKLVVWQMNAQGMRLQGLFTTPDAPAGALSWRVVGPR